jgi:hypothetical protein
VRGTSHRWKGVTLAAMILLASAAPGEIADSHHDFGGASWARNQICQPCHTPHHADQAVSDSPLWNHEVTPTTFTLYSTPTLDAAMSQPSGITKLCLSCHDGTVAIDSYGGQSGTRMINALGNLGTDLGAHHPVSFTYDSGLAASDGELHDPSTTPSGLGSTIERDLLYEGKLECSSCHDVHVARNTSGCTGCHVMHHGDVLNKANTLSLRKSNANSELCLTCHKK